MEPLGGQCHYQGEVTFRKRVMKVKDEKCNDGYY